VPAYGFERIMDPPPLEVNTLRLLTEFHHGSLAMSDTWARMLAPASLDIVLTLAEEAGVLASSAQTRLGIAGGGEGSGGGAAGHSTEEMAEALAAFHFPDDWWARVVYDLVVAARDADAPVEKYVAALVPIYFGRVGSFVIENRHLTTDQAEERVERQAREFELLKPYLVERWNDRPRRSAKPAVVGASAGADASGGAGPTATSRVGGNGRRRAARGR
jgi:hypothetical protein